MLVLTAVEQGTPLWRLTRARGTAAVLNVSISQPVEAISQFIHSYYGSYVCVDILSKKIM